MILANIYPKLSDNIFIQNTKDRVLYLNAEYPDWISIKVTYKEIFDLFNGQNSFQDIAKYIKKNYADDSPELLVRQIENLVNNSKIFMHNQNSNGKKCDSSNPTLKYVYLTLTDNCNLNCRYCYAKERTKFSTSGLSEWIMYINKVLSISQPIDFTFTGGEPLLVPFLFDLAKYIKNRGSNSILLTNGIGILNEKIAKNIAQYFSQVRISLDSLDMKTSDYLRGRGVSKRVEEAINLLDKAGANVLVVATITQLNKYEIAEFSTHFNNRVSFQPLYKMGSGRECLELTISGLEYYQALSNAEVLKVLPGYRQNIHSFRGNPYKRCAMASEELSIGPNGDLYPCHMLHYPELRIGSFNTDDIKNLYFGSELLNNLRCFNVDIIEQCKDCVVRNFCGAGCRARVDYNKQGLMGYDSFCIFEKQSILNSLLYSFE